MTPRTEPRSEGNEEFSCGECNKRRGLPHQKHHQMMLFCMSVNSMRTTVTLNDELVKGAQEYTGIEEKSALVNAALKALIEREAAHRLARLGGSVPGMKPIPRRRPAAVSTRQRRSKLA